MHNFLRKRPGRFLNVLFPFNICPVFRVPIDGISYFCIGQQNDARVNLMLALSAIRNGAKCANYVEVVNLLFQEETKGMRHIYFHLNADQGIQEWTK